MLETSAHDSAAELYRHFDQDLGTWITIRAFDLDDDLERFHRWQNSERVAKFWNERGTLEEHRQYIAKLQASSHYTPLIGCFDQDPFLYMEIYWAVHDPIAEHYPANRYDRGIHVLVGEERHRGPQKVNAWLSTLCRFLFEDSPPTKRIVCEPQHDCRTMIGYLHAQGFDKVKEFDLPHKRAALMSLTRETFFEGQNQ